MNKLLTTIMSFIFVVTAFTSANSIEFRLGATAQGSAFYGTADETRKDNGIKTSEEVIAGFSYGSAFAEVAFEEAFGVTFGLEYTPDSIHMNKTTRTISDQATNSTVRTGNDSGDQVIDAAVEDLMTAYIQVPIMGSGLYAKVGYINGDLIPRETLATGSTYNNVDLEGFEYGMGYMGSVTDLIFYKVESTFIDFDDIRSNGSEEGGTAGSFNTINARLGGVAAKASIGVRF